MKLKPRSLGLLFVLLIAGVTMGPLIGLPGLGLLTVDDSTPSKPLPDQPENLSNETVLKSTIWRNEAGGQKRPGPSPRTGTLLEE